MGSATGLDYGAVVAVAGVLGIDFATSLVYVQVLEAEQLEADGKARESEQVKSRGR